MSCRHRREPLRAEYHKQGTSRISGSTSTNTCICLTAVPLTTTSRHRSFVTRHQRSERGFGGWLKLRRLGLQCVSAILIASETVPLDASEADQSSESTSHPCWSLVTGTVTRSSPTAPVGRKESVPIFSRVCCFCR